MSNEVKKVVRGYKVFAPDWTCTPRGRCGNKKQYTCPGKFEEEGTIAVCGHGMHFCQSAIDCFSYYGFNPNNKVAEVIAYGDVLTKGDKSCTNKLEIVREIPWEEVLRLVNIGNDCTGFGNTGNWNAGDKNTGNNNTGYWNAGDNNTGNCNTGYRNSGNHNTGTHNTGSWNTGDRNTGDCNTGRNNSGDFNVGNFNKSSHNAGCFNAREHTIMLFDKPSDWKYNDWVHSRANLLLNNMPFYNGDRQEWWNNLSELNKSIIKAIPNFDADIFYECTGIRVD